MSVNVRLAEQTDIPWLREQLRVFAREAAAPIPFPDDATADETIRRGMASGPWFIAETARQAGRRIGLIAGVLTPNPHSAAETLLVETYWWVVHEFRGTRAGAALLEAYHAFGGEHADRFVMTLEANSAVKPATLERHGYALTELAFTRLTARGRDSGVGSQSDAAADGHSKGTALGGAPLPSPAHLLHHEDGAVTAHAGGT